MLILAKELERVKGLERAEWEKWADVKEDFWGDLRPRVQAMLKRVLESSMEIEVNDLIGSRRWEHNEQRRTYRNGSYSRTLLTTYGYIQDIKVPRVRDGGLNFKTIPRYKRRSNDVDETVRGMFLSGVSTRRVKEVLVPLVGKDSLSATTVSTITKQLDRYVSRFHNRYLSDDYEYLLCDGIYLNTKSPQKKARRAVLVVYGITRAGIREIIDYQLAVKGESEAAWLKLLNCLYHRGLKGDNLKLAVIDGNNGLKNALEYVYPRVEIQLCWAHKMRNVANYLPKKLGDDCINEARGIYSQETHGDAVYVFKRWADNWRLIVPKAVKCVEHDLENLLNFYKQPHQLWIKLRTTNIIERVFREVRRRTRPMSCFNNSQSVDRIIFAIFNRQNNIWKDTPLFKCL
jgi:transposase-like protein